MLKEIVGKIWRITPSIIRLLIIRATQKKFTVSVGAIIINDESQILLLDHVLRPGSGWGIPGGFIEANESPVNAIKRELCEEIGLEIEKVEMIHIRTINRHIEIIFSARPVGTAEVKSFEIKALGWFTFENMPKEVGERHKQFIKAVLSKEAKC